MVLGSGSIVELGSLVGLASTLVLDDCDDVVCFSDVVGSNENWRVHEDVMDVSANVVRSTVITCFHELLVVDESSAGGPKVAICFHEDVEVEINVDDVVVVAVISVLIDGSSSEDGTPICLKQG